MFPLSNTKVDVMTFFIVIIKSHANLVSKRIYHLRFYLYMPSEATKDERAKNVFF